MDVVFSNMNTRVLKEPLGFIRLLELPLAILAFAATAGYSVKTIVDYNCPGSVHGTYDFYWGYTFDLTSVTVPANFCNPVNPVGRYVFAVGAVSQSQFFVFTGVVCFLYVLLILIVYLLAWQNYENDMRYSLVDFVVTAILALFWFISSCAWASGVTTVKGQTDIQEILTRLRTPGQDGVYPCNVPGQTTNACGIASPHWNYASLNVSLIAGFACCGLWAANLWFIYKETIWYKARAEAAATPSPGTGVGPAGAGGEVPYR